MNHSMRLALCLFLTLFIFGCENNDAGIDAAKALTLSDQVIRGIAERSTEYSDKTHAIAPPGNHYAKRLKKIVGMRLQNEGIDFNYKVYLAPEVNSFAMADGSIRIYSGLMDLLDDDEVRFIVDHEMGHIAGKHVQKKLQLIYTASAARKGVASINGNAGGIARSRLGSFSQSLMNAQFSPLEEKEADGYAFEFMKTMGYKPKAAISALEKLATLDDTHAFRAHHPEPGKRAKHLRLQLEGKTKSPEYWIAILNQVKSLTISLFNKLFAIGQIIRNLF